MQTNRATGVGESPECQQEVKRAPQEARAVYLPSPTALGSAKLLAQGRLHRVTQRAASAPELGEAPKQIVSPNHLGRRQAAAEEQYRSAPLMSSSRGLRADLEDTAKEEKKKEAVGLVSSKTSAIVERAMKTTRRIAIQGGAWLPEMAPGSGLSTPVQQVEDLASAGTRSRAPMRTGCAPLASRPAGSSQHTQCTIS